MCVQRLADWILHVAVTSWHVTWYMQYEYNVWHVFLLCSKMQRGSLVMGGFIYSLPTAQVIVSQSHVHCRRGPYMLSGISARNCLSPVVVVTVWGL